MNACIDSSPPYEHHDDSQEKEDQLGHNNDDHGLGEGDSLSIVDVPEERKKSVNLKMLKLIKIKALMGALGLIISIDIHQDKVF